MSLALVKEIRRVRNTVSASTTSDVPDDVVEFARSVDLDPDPWQQEVITSTHPRKILCCGRQTGKSTVAAILAIHKALTQPGSTVQGQRSWLWHLVNDKPSYSSARRPVYTSRRAIHYPLTLRDVQGSSCPMGA